MNGDRGKGISLRLPENQLKLLKELAYRENCSVSAIIRRAIDEYAERREAELSQPIPTCK